MKICFLTILALFFGLNTIFAQSADPAVTGANFVSNQINTGQTSTLTVSFANTGSTYIPISSIELTISTAFSYYTTNGTTAPTGAGANFFTWTYTGVPGSSDTWRGVNNVAIGAFNGGNILLIVTGNTVSPGFESTNINVQAVDSLSKFSDSQINNSLQPQLKINQACPLAPVLSGNTKSNVCPLTTADLTTLQPAAVPGQTFEWHTVASNPTAGTIVSQPTQVPAGTYYLYAKSVCYSPASAATTVTISVCTSPDLTISIGQPSPLPVAATTSFIPVTVTNIGTAPSSGLITVTAQIPFGTVFGMFPASNNGWACTTTGITATCTSSAPILTAANTIFSVPFIPKAAQVANSLIIPAAIVSGGGEGNTGNNSSNTITTINVSNIDLMPNYTYSSTTYTINSSKTVIVNVNEIANNSTNGTVISVFIPNSVGFTYSINPVLTSVTVVGPETVDNPDWTMTVNPAGMLLTSNANVVIAGNGRSRIAITITANTAGARANLTANVSPHGGGETSHFNNIVSLAQSIQN